jgi:hypothetical protein
MCAVRLFLKRIFEKDEADTFGKVSASQYDAPIHKFAVLVDSAVP